MLYLKRIQQPLGLNIHNVIYWCRIEFVVVDHFIVSPILDKKALNELVDVSFIGAFTNFRVTSFNTKFYFLTFHRFLKTLNL